MRMHIRSYVSSKLCMYIDAYLNQNFPGSEKVAAYVELKMPG